MNVLLMESDGFDYCGKQVYYDRNDCYDRYDLKGEPDMNISAVTARRRFGELLNRVILTDEEITIERSGKEVAKLIKSGISTSHRQKEGKLDFRKSRGLGKEVWADVDAEQYVIDERSEWN